MSIETRPVTLLIGALGGEGGGVLTDWVVSAATALDLPVQSTSIPGVAQRTGATTYYVEIYPVPTSELDGRTPTMALYPGPGNVDVMVASELLEAGRAMELGFVSPDRTTLVASTHRIYAIAEKSAMGDGRYDAERIVAAARELAARPVLLDLVETARGAGAQLNAVLAGAIAGTGVLPIPAGALEGAVRRGGKAVEENLRGFRAGFERVRAETTAPAASPLPEAEIPGQLPTRLTDVIVAFPPGSRDLVEEGARLVLDYQDEPYARLYLERLERLGSGSASEEIVTECARQLALWMTYEDVIRVADLKTRPERMARIRREVGALPEEPVRVTEFLKPGLDEVCAILPPTLARWSRAVARGWWPQVSLRIGTHGVLGHWVLRGLAGLKSIRRRSTRFVDEQAEMEVWLATVVQVAGSDEALALEIVACAGLRKGYGETFERGRGSYRRVMDEVVAPALAASRQGAAQTVRAAREAAQADPEGKALAGVLVAAPALGRSA